MYRQPNLCKQVNSKWIYYKNWLAKTFFEHISYLNVWLWILHCIYFHEILKILVTRKILNKRDKLAHDVVLSYMYKFDLINFVLLQLLLYNKEMLSKYVQFEIKYSESTWLIRRVRSAVTMIVCCCINNLDNNICESSS